MRIVTLTSLLATSTRALHSSLPGFSTFRHTNSKALFQRQMTVRSKEALLACPSIPLYDNTPHPAIGFGTYKVGFIPSSASSAVAAAAPTTVERTAEECVADALSVGYRFLECAEFYGNESEVGKAIKASGIPREELFICSKVWTTTIEKGEDAIREQLEKTLSDLGTDYVDLYLIHWPVPGKHVDAYKVLEKLKSEGKIINIGVSNYAVEDYKELMENGVSVKPAVNQVSHDLFISYSNVILVLNTSLIKD